MQLQSWELNANMYDGTSTAGPVPTIFSGTSKLILANVAQKKIRNVVFALLFHSNLQLQYNLLCQLYLKANSHTY